MAEQRHALEWVAMVIVAFLLVVIALTFGGYFYKEARYKNRLAEAERKDEEQRQLIEKSVAAMSLDQMIDAVRLFDDKFPQIQARLLTDPALWRPAKQLDASEADKARLDRALTELGAVFGSSVDQLLDLIATSDKAVQPRLLAALVAGVGRKVDGRGQDVGASMFARGGAAWLTPAAMDGLHLLPEDQAKMARKLLYDPSPEGRTRLLAWVLGGYVTTSQEFPGSLVEALKSEHPNWESDASPDERAFVKELGVAEAAAVATRAKHRVPGRR